MNGIDIEVAHELHCTMVDGKTANVFAGQKCTSSCNVCPAKSKDMNNIRLLKSLTANSEMYKFGLSTLHCWIRAMEFMLHIAYNMQFKKSQARGEDKLIKLAAKKRIQNELKSELGILVDFVRQGVGTTNDGNTARRFFSNLNSVATILNINSKYLYRYSTILQVS